MVISQKGGGVFPREAVSFCILRGQHTSTIEAITADGRHIVVASFRYESGAKKVISEIAYCTERVYQIPQDNQKDEQHDHFGAA